MVFEKMEFRDKKQPWFTIPNYTSEENQKNCIFAVYKESFSGLKTDVPVYNQNHLFFRQFIINLHAVLMCYENEHIFWTQNSK